MVLRALALWKSGGGRGIGTRGRVLHHALMAFGEGNGLSRIAQWPKAI